MYLNQTKSINFYCPLQHYRKPASKPPSLITLTHNKLRNDDQKHKMLIRLKNYLNKTKASKNYIVDKTHLNRAVNTKKKTKLKPQAANRSVDIITSKPRCMFKKVCVMPIPAMQEIIQSKEELEPSNNKSKKKSLMRYTTARNSGMSKKLKQLKSRHSSTSLSRVPRFSSIEQNTPEGKKKGIVNNINEDRIFNYLQNTLSKLITESVYFKDYFKLFLKYKADLDRKYNYRSKSQDRNGKWHSVRKIHFNTYCLFTDFLHNVCMQYKLSRELKKQKTTTSRAVNLKNVKFMRSSLFKSIENEKQSGSITKISGFNFFGFNGALKELSYAIKNYNETGILYYNEPDSLEDVDFNIGTKNEARRSIMHNRQTGLDYSIISRPVNNTKSAILFQRLIRDSVSAEKKKAKKLQIKRKINNCILKSTFFVKNTVEKKKDEGKLKKPNKEITKPKSAFIDIEKVYKIPKSFRLRNVSKTSKENNLTYENKKRMKFVHSLVDQSGN